MQPLKPIIFCLLAFTLSQASIINVPADHATIQEGINAAVDGDTVLVAEGTYYENINYNGKAISVASHFAVDGDTTHIANTIIDGSKATNADRASVVNFESGEDTTSVLLGLTITGGKGTKYSGGQCGGGGIFVNNAAPKILYNIIRNNSLENSQDGYTMGGGICVTISSHSEFIVIEDNDVVSNHISASGGSVYGGGVFVGANAEILNNQIMNNKVAFTGASTEVATGGGLCCKSEPIDAFIDVKIVGNTVQNNFVQSTQAAFVGGVDLMVTNTLFTDNIVKGNSIQGDIRNNIPGMRIINRSDSLLLERNVFSENSAVGSAPSAGGGLIVIFMKKGTIRNNTFEKNNSDEGVGLRLAATENFEILNNDFIENESATNCGGVLLEQSRNIHLYSNIFKRNSSKVMAGGCYIINSDALFDNNLFIANKAGMGAGLAAQQAEIELVNNTFFDNSADNNGGSALFASGATIRMLNTICWDDTSKSAEIRQAAKANVSLAFSNIKGGYEGVAIYDDNPVFRDSLLALSDESPCIGKGALEYDFGGIVLSCPSQDYNLLQRPNPTDTSPDLGAVESLLSNPKTRVNYNYAARPTKITLKQNYPNPFNPSTTIEYSLPQPARVSVTVYNLRGQIVRTLVDEEQSAGARAMLWRGEDERGAQVSSGIYFYRLRARDAASGDILFDAERKMALMR